MNLATTQIEYRVADESGGVALNSKWSQNGPTLQQAIDWCEYMTEVEEAFSETLHTYHVECRVVIRTPWEAIQ